MNAAVSRFPHAPRRLFTTAALLSLLACGSERGDTPQAQQTEGSCRRNATVDLPAELAEASGIAVSRQHTGVFWLHNDSGGDPLLYAVDAVGRLLGTVRVEGAENKDWEDIALGPCPSGTCLYIADTGDNDAKRDDVAIYRVPEPAPGDAETVPAEKFEMRYPNGPRDTEALFVLPDGSLYLIAKGRDHPVELFRAPSATALRQDSTVTLRSVRKLSPGPVPQAAQITGADASRDGAVVAVRSYGSLLLYRTRDLLEAAERAPLRVDLAPVGEMQGEGVGVRTGGAVVLASEGAGKNVPGTLSSLQCSLPR